MINFISSLKNRTIMLSEQLIVSGHRQILSGVVKFDQFLTDRFLMFEIRKHFWKYISEGFTGKPPCNLISFFDIFAMTVNKVNLTSKAFQSPFNSGYLGVVALKKVFVQPIRTGFAMISGKRQAALGINKSSQIGKVIITSGLTETQRGQKLFMFYRNQIVSLFNVLDLINEKILFIFGKAFDKLTVYPCLFLFFDKKGKYVLNESKRFSSSNYEVVLRFMSNMFQFIRTKTIRTLKCLGKVLNDIFISRRNDESSQIFDAIGIFNLYFSKIKAAIPVSISGYVGKGFVVHA